MTLAGQLTESGLYEKPFSYPFKLKEADLEVLTALWSASINLDYSDNLIIRVIR
jgi:hypothetical protein